MAKIGVKTIKCTTIELQKKKKDFEEMQMHLSVRSVANFENEMYNHL